MKPIEPLVFFVLLHLTAAPLRAEPTATVTVRGKDQKVHLYGPREGPPVVVASGDGGWIHLGVDVAEFLGGRGWSVLGVDSKAYLSSFTEAKGTLAPADVPGDLQAFIDYARRGRPERVLLAGVSEGAGLAVLAASAPGVQASITGVLALGLPNINELGWRFKDNLIYLTHKTPKEPTFAAADYVPRLGSVPLAAVHSTHDEFVPLDEVKTLMALPGGPKKLWIVEARNHRFSDNAAELHERLLEAIEWIRNGGR